MFPGIGWAGFENSKRPVFIGVFERLWGWHA